MQKRYFVLTMISLIIIMNISVSAGVVKKSIDNNENGNSNDVTNIIADVYVDDDRDTSWYDQVHVKTIQEGVNNASTNDKIFVYNGTYREVVEINKTINLVGENKNSTIITPHITVDSCYNKISGFTIYGESVIRVHSNNNILFKNNFSNRFWVYGSNNTVRNCNAYRIILYDIHATNCTISNNHLMGSNSQISVWNSANGNNILNNLITGNSSEYFVKGPGIDLISSSNNVISGNTIENMLVGIDMYENCDKNIINNNSIDKTLVGIKIIRSDNNEIYSNNFFKCLVKASFVKSIGNKWYNNYWGGPRLLPKAIRGRIGLIGLIPWRNIDWKPAKLPNLI